MTCLFFNDCHPGDRPLSVYVAALHETLSAYIYLSKKGHELCVVTSSHQDSLTLSDEINLKRCIIELKDRDERNYALRLFSKYPIGNYYDEMVFADKILDAPYYIDVDGEIKDATNLAVVSYSEGLLFTLGVCDAFCNDRLVLHSESDTLDVLNLYGSPLNTELIDAILTQAAIESQDLLSQVLTSIKGKAHTAFSNSFSRMPKLSQRSVLSAFMTANLQNKLFPIYADNKLIKDVTPGNGKKGKMYELRIYTPVAIRVYFYQKNETIYLVDVCGKAGNQNSDIKRAYMRIEY